MPFGTSSCTWDRETETLHLLSAHGAWQVRLWPNPAVLHVAGPRGRWQPPLYLELAGAPCPRSPVAVAIALAARTVPEPVRTCVLRFAPASEQLAALQALYRVPALLTLLDELPVLGRLTADTVRARPDDVAALARDLAATAKGRSRREILLEWLGLPATRLFQRALARAVAPDAWRPEDLLDLGAWTRATPRPVSFLQVLSPGQVRLWRMTTDRGLAHLCTPQLMASLQHHTSLPVSVDLAAALDVIAAGERRSGRAARGCKSGRDLLRRLMDAQDLVPELDHADPPRGPNGGVANPIACPVWIRPLADATDHAREGVEMDHCLENPQWYARQERGEGYAYAVEHPVGRVTAWVEATAEAGVFTLTALHGVQDADPPLDAEASVRDWVARHNAWARHQLHGGPRPSGAPVQIPPAAIRFVDVPRDQRRTLMLVGGIVDERSPLQPPDDPQYASAERALLEGLPAPRTLEQDVRTVLLPMARELRQDSLRLARLVEAMDPDAASGESLNDATVYGYLTAVSRTGLYLSCFELDKTHPPTWPPKQAEIDLDDTHARLESEIDIPF